MPTHPWGAHKVSPCQTHLYIYHFQSHEIFSAYFIFVNNVYLVIFINWKLYWIVRNSCCCCYHYCYESDSDTDCNWCAWCSHQRIDTGTGGVENKRASGDHTLLRLARILRIVLETWDLLLLRLKWKIISWCECEKH